MHTKIYMQVAPTVPMLDGHHLGQTTMQDFRIEHDSMGAVQVPADRLWGAQTQRSLEHFSIGAELMPRAMIGAFALIKRAAAIANGASGRLDAEPTALIVQVCD